MEYHFKSTGFKFKLALLLPCRNTKNDLLNTVNSLAFVSTQLKSIRIFELVMINLPKKYLQTIK